MKWAKEVGVRFQFLYGTIKSLRKEKGWTQAERFNSSMVQLKAAERADCKASSTSFNSSMVQLKAIINVPANVTLLFQFLYGTIKSLAPCVMPVAGLRFNSSMVQLKVYKPAIQL